MKTTISSKGQFVLPRALRDQDGIEAGQEFTIERLGSGQYKLSRRKKKNEGFVAALLSCPQKGWFRPLASESTDTL